MFRQVSSVFRQGENLTPAQQNELQDACEERARMEAHSLTQNFRDHLADDCQKEMAEIVRHLIRGTGPDRIVAKMMADKICTDWIAYREGSMDQEERDEIERETFGEDVTADEFDDDAA